MSARAYSVPSVALRMIKERTIKVARAYVRTPDDAAAIAHREIGNRPNENLIAIVVDGTGHVSSIVTVSVGGMHGCAVSARDILRAVLVAHGAAFVLAHNHPSGDPSPSSEDVAFTSKIREACDVVGIRMLDHVIVTADPERWGRAS